MMGKSKDHFRAIFKNNPKTVIGVDVGMKEYSGELFIYHENKDAITLKYKSGPGCWYFSDIDITDITAVKRKNVPA